MDGISLSSVYCEQVRWCRKLILLTFDAPFVIVVHLPVALRGRSSGDHSRCGLFVDGETISEKLLNQECVTKYNTAIVAVGFAAGSNLIMLIGFPKCDNMPT